MFVLARAAKVGSLSVCSMCLSKMEKNIVATH